MDKPGSRNSSLQRKKPPWLKLDIPTIQLTPDDSPTPTQVEKVEYRSYYLDKGESTTVLRDAKLPEKTSDSMVYVPIFLKFVLELTSPSII